MRWHDRQAQKISHLNLFQSLRGFPMRWHRNSSYFVCNPIAVSIPKRVSDALALYHILIVEAWNRVSIPKRVSDALAPDQAAISLGQMASFNP